MAKYGTVLVFEDNPLVAMDAEETLRAKGFQRVLAARSEDSAVSIAREEALDFALVAAFTSHANSCRVAEQLARRGIPFAFACDFADGSDRPSTWAGTPYVVRPYNEQDVAGLLERLAL
jgi:DNA-binding NarL/FixJ family response regulator